VSEDKVDVLGKLEVADGEKKKKRKIEQGRITMEIHGKDSGLAIVAATGGETKVKSPLRRKGL
jgi:hypothetical protein